MKIVLGNHSFRGMAALWAAMITLSLLASGCPQPDDDTPRSSDRAITGFSFTNSAATWVIDRTAKTVRVTVPYGTNVSSLTPVITVSAGATVSPSSGTAQDFSSPVTYTVRAEDGTTETYTVTVTVAPPRTAKAITDFKFTNPAATGDIDEEAKTIRVTLPYGMAVNSLTPVITISAGATVSPSSGTAQDFSSPVTYTVRAEDGTTETYTVTVIITPPPSSAKAITDFSFTNPEATGDIDEEAKTIRVTLPYGTAVNSLIPVITISAEATVSPSSGTAQDFSSPVSYTVRAEDGTTETYTVTVTIAPPPSSAKAITDFSFTSPVATGNIDEAAKTIRVTLPYGTAVDSLTPVITISAKATVNPDSETAQDFSSPVSYTVRAEDGTTETYTVTVRIQGQGDVTLINPTDAAREALSGGGITIAKTAGTYKQTETLTIVGTFDQRKWRVDGTVKGTGSSLILDAGDYAEGTHQVSLEVTLKGVPYSKAGTFTVVQ